MTSPSLFHLISIFYIFEQWERLIVNRMEQYEWVEWKMSENEWALASELSEFERIWTKRMSYCEMSEQLERHCEMM